MIDANAVRELQAEHARICRLLDQAVEGANMVSNLVDSVRERCEHLAEAQAELGSRIDAAMEDRR